MDENKASLCRRPRGRLTPSLESLEGRRLLSAARSQVTISEGLSQGTPTLLILGTNKADVINIADNGTGAAGNITVTLGNGSTYTTQTAVSEIEVSGMGGNDQISYTLTGNLVAERTVLVQLGSGKQDQFLANINGDIDNNPGLDLEAYGGAGHDTMTINQTGEILEGSFIPFLDAGRGNSTLTFNGTGAVDGGATLSPALSGGTGNDTIVSNYSGTIDGNYIYNMTVNAGNGNDNITDDINVGPGSVGTVGTGAGSAAIIKGGRGKDHIHYAISVDPTATAAQVYAAVTGLHASDTVERTANVSIEGPVKTDSIISS